MKEIILYQCEICGATKPFKPAMGKHEIACRRKKEAEDERERCFLLAQDEFLNSVENPEKFHIRTMEWMKKWNHLKLEIIQEELKFSQKVSNTHVCPHNGVTNWWSNEGLPKGYPGWTAHWVIGLSKKDYNSISFLSTIFEGYPDKRCEFTLTGIHCGSGGSWSKPHGGKCEEYLHYYMSFFLDDFPNLKGKWLTQQILREGYKTMKTGEK